MLSHYPTVLDPLVTQGRGGREYNIVFAKFLTFRSALCTSRASTRSTHILRSRPLVAVVDEASEASFRLLDDLLFPLIEESHRSNDERRGFLSVFWVGPIHADYADHLHGL